MPKAMLTPNRMRAALTDEMGPRLNEIIRRLHVLEEASQRIEKRLRDLHRPDIVAQEQKPHD